MKRFCFIICIEHRSNFLHSLSWLDFWQSLYCGNKKTLFKNMNQRRWKLKTLFAWTEQLEETQQRFPKWSWKSPSWRSFFRFWNGQKYLIFRTPWYLAAINFVSKILNGFYREKVEPVPPVNLPNISYN